MEVSQATGTSKRFNGLRQKLSILRLPEAWDGMRCSWPCHMSMMGENEITTDGKGCWWFLRRKRCLGYLGIPYRNGTLEVYTKKHMFLTNPELLYGKTPGWCNPHESHVVASFFSISLWYSHMLSPYYIIYSHKMVAQSFIITMVMRCNKITRASILIQGIQGIQGALFVKHCTAWGQAEQGCSQQLLVWVVNGVKI